MRSIFGVVVGAYAGGVIASYAVLAWLRISVADPTPGIYPVYFGVGIMFFTLPGAILVAGIFNQLTHKGFRRPAAYVLAAMTGTVVGGLILLFLFTDWSSMAIGALYGAFTSVAWAAIDALLRPAARSETIMDQRATSA